LPANLKQAEGLRTDTPGKASMCTELSHESAREVSLPSRVGKEAQDQIVWKLREKHCFCTVISE